MRLARRTFLHVALGAALLPALAGAGWAEAYPNRPVTIIVPFAPGGASDVVGRIRPSLKIAPAIRFQR
jgi:tripartite-type tricarboxylate transporter receptor subunit TctC